MARKHSGLGRGIDALIPGGDIFEETVTPAEESSKQEAVSTETPLKKTSSKTATAKKTVSDDSKKKTAVKKKESVENVSRETNPQGARIVRVTEIEPNRSQPRKQFDEEALQELADSIKQVGLIEPIIVADKGNHLEIVAGERRWRAAKLAGIKEVPVIVREYTARQIMEIALIENLQREDLNPIEEANAYRSLIEEYSLKQEEVAERVSKSRTAIANTLRLLKLTEKVQQMLVSGDISMGHARALIPVEDENVQLSLAEKVRDEKLSVREVEKLVQNLGKEKPVKKEKDPAIELIFRQQEEKMKKSLGTGIKIKSNGKKGGKIEIDFYSYDEFDRIAYRILGRE